MTASEIKRTSADPNPPTKISLISEILGEERNIYIQLPEGYGQAQKAYPVLFVLDGEWLFEIVRANLRFYSEVEVMGNILPQMILVGIENVDRDRDYVPTPDPQDPPTFKTAGKADLFAAFLAEELFPHLEQNYHALPNRTVVGWSFSGLFALYAAIRHQDLFDTYLCCGPAIWWDDELVVKRFKETPIRNKKRAVITCGSDEKGGSVYESVQSLLKTLKEERTENFDCEYLEFEAVGHSWSVPRAVAQGLIHLFKDYIPKDEIKSFEELNKYYNHLSSLWGYEVIPPDWLLLDLMNGLWAADDKEEAFKVLEILLTHHPDSSLVHFYRGKYLALLDKFPKAIESFQNAIMVESAHPVPNTIYLRTYKEQLNKINQSQSLT